VAVARCGYSTARTCGGHPLRAIPLLYSATAGTALCPEQTLRVLSEVPTMSHVVHSVKRRTPYAAKPLTVTQIREAATHWLDKSMRSGRDSGNRVWTASSLSRASGVSRNTIFRIAKGLTTVDQGTLNKLADAMSVPALRLTASNRLPQPQVTRAV